MSTPRSRSDTAICLRGRYYKQEVYHCQCGKCEVCLWRYAIRPRHPRFREGNVRGLRCGRSCLKLGTQHATRERAMAIAKASFRLIVPASDILQQYSVNQAFGCPIALPSAGEISSLFDVTVAEPDTYSLTLASSSAPSLHSHIRRKSGISFKIQPCELDLAAVSTTAGQTQRQLSLCTKQRIAFHRHCT